MARYGRLYNIPGSGYCAGPEASRVNPTPLVSVLIPTHDYARYLPAAIESVLAQDLDDFELIVVDDASTDDTRGVLESYAGRDRRLRWQVNPANLGLVANWNRCLRQARGEYIKYVFGDDFLVEPDALSRMARILRSDPAVSLVASARRIVDEHSAETDVWCHWPDGAVRSGGEVIRRCLLDMRNYVGEPTAVMFRRSQAHRGFHPAYLQLVDLEMWFHLLDAGAFAYVSTPLCAFRQHALQQTQRARRERLDILDQQYLLRDYLHHPQVRLSAGQRWYLQFDLVRSYRRLARTDHAIRPLAVELLTRYGAPRYFLGYPAYRAYRTLRKICR